MEALFDQTCELVGWMDRGTYIYDTEMHWVAFIFNRHAWSVKTGNWLGPVHGTICLDHRGCVVAWHSRYDMYGGTVPIRPLKPILQPAPPVTPDKPPTLPKPTAPNRPPTGWSELAWLDWISQ